MKNLFYVLLMGLSLSNYAQEEDWDFDEESSDKSSNNEELKPIFYDTKVINSQSVETLEKGTLDFRIAHRFGNMATANSYQTLFGFDNSSDISIGFDYGISDKLLIGIHRKKGAGPFSQIMEGKVKYKLIDQLDEKPFSLTFSSSAFGTTMPSSTDSTSLTYFTKTAQRMSYFSQLIIARNFNNHLSLQLNAGVLHRNLVYSSDVNTAFSVGGVAKVKVAKKMSIIGEYNHLFRPTNELNGTKYVDPIGVGLEIKTFAHVFQINLTNSRGMGAVQYLPYTFSRWDKGEFRLGFTITRHF